MTMALHALSAIFLWWASTAAILALCSLNKRTFGWSLLGVSFVVGAALWGIVQSAWNVSVLGTYVAFVSALAVWGWIETSFLMGYVTGPRTAPCPADATGLRRFILAIETVLYHELAIITGAILLVILTWGAPNLTGTFTFLILMAMRISAKVNIYLGVPNLTDEFMPERLAYLKTYFRKRDFGPFFPLSMAVATFLATLLAGLALNATGAQAVGYTLLFTLTSLAILEHLFMILPLQDAALWRWAMATVAPKQIEKP
jgi:putative photosynthetic complex assembly protein 2